MSPAFLTAEVTTGSLPPASAWSVQSYPKPARTQGLASQAFGGDESTGQGGVQQSEAEEPEGTMSSQQPPADRRNEARAHTGRWLPGAGRSWAATARPTTGRAASALTRSHRATAESAQLARILHPSLPLATCMASESSKLKNGAASGPESSDPSAACVHAGAGKPGAGDGKQGGSGVGGGRAAAVPGAHKSARRVRLKHGVLFPHRWLPSAAAIRIWVPRATRAQETRWSAVGSRVTSRPVSAMTAMASLWLTPGISTSRSAAAMAAASGPGSRPGHRRR